MQSEYGPLNRAVADTAKKLNLKEDKVDKIYRAYCKLIKDKLASLPLQEITSEEEFNKLQVNVNLPSLGKLYTSWVFCENLKKRKEYVQKAQENKAAKHRLIGNNESL